MDELDGAPNQVLGLRHKTRTQIVLKCLIPSILELLVYMTVIMADICVTIQHFRDKNPLFGAITLTLIWLPPIACFISIVISPWQWPDVDDEQSGCSTIHVKFFGKQIFNFVLFPLGAVYRFVRRIFWSIESLFHQRDSFERHHAVEKAAETSPFELYHFLQAYLQSAPQIIIQLYILLREDVFRNYETTTVQVISIVFSLIIMGWITMSYQRFESQKVVGRNYPWVSLHQARCRKDKFKRTKSYLDELKSYNDGQSTIQMVVLPESDTIMKNFIERHTATVDPIHMVETDIPASLTSRYGGEMKPTENEFNNTKSLNLGENNLNTIGLQKDYHEPFLKNITNNDKLSTTTDYGDSMYGDTKCQESPEKIRRLQFRSSRVISSDVNQSPLSDEIDPISRLKRNINSLSFDEDENEIISAELDVRQNIMSVDFDAVPNDPPPMAPNATSHFSLNPFNQLGRLSTYKDMLIFNAENYIKEHVPRLPRGMFDHDNEKKSNTKSNDNTMKQMGNATMTETDIDMELIIRKKNDLDSYQMDDNGRPVTRRFSLNIHHDEVDMVMPRRRKTVEGIEQEDFVAQSVSFISWIMFLIMRMTALSMFSVFYPKECLYMCLIHYGIMLLCLLIEVNFHEKIERVYFYLFLAYVYIFTIIEFKIKFIHVRKWYIGYVLLVLLENIIITLVWYFTCEFDSWWFDYLYWTVWMTGVYSVWALLVYYYILKPKDVVLFVD